MEEIVSQVVETSEEGSFPYMIYIGIALVIAIIVYIVQKPKQEFQDSPEIPQGSLVYLMGQCGSGKTALLYALAREKDVRTASSMEVNQATINMKFSEDQSKNIPVIDIPGHNFCKQRFIKDIKGAKAIIVMVDSSNMQKQIEKTIELSQLLTPHPLQISFRNTFSETAKMVYDILIQKSYISLRIPILIALNKQDEPKSMKLADFQHRFVMEMDKVKILKRAVVEEGDDIQDWIKDSKFDVGETNIKMCETCVLQEEISQVLRFLEENA